MKTKRTKHNGMFLAALLLAGLMVAVVTGACSQSGNDGVVAKPVEAKPAAGPVVKGWTEDLDLAMKYAARTKRPIVLDFTGSDWCGWCIRLHDEVFSKDAFKDYADKNLVLVAIDFPRNKKLPDDIKRRNSKLAARYGVRGFPTIVILDSTGEKELGRTGYVRGGPAAFIAGVKKIIGK